MSETALHYMTITEVAALIGSGELSPVEATQAQLDRIAELDGHLKSYATVMGEHASMQARRAEREIADGTYRGPLHGVPIAVKDLCFTNGVRTMGGCEGPMPSTCRRSTRPSWRGSKPPEPCCWAS